MLVAVTPGALLLPLPPDDPQPTIAAASAATAMIAASRFLPPFRIVLLLVSPAVKGVFEIRYVLRLAFQILESEVGGGNQSEKGSPSHGVAR
jgi:hypothetical protein